MPSFDPETRERWRNQWIRGPIPFPVDTERARAHALSLVGQYEAQENERLRAATEAVEEARENLRCLSVKRRTLEGPSAPSEGEEVDRG